VAKEINLDALDPVLVDRAFRLQEKIKDQGLQGIDYMGAAEFYIRRNAPPTVSKHVKTQLKAEFGKNVS